MTDIAKGMLADAEKDAIRLTGVPWNNHPDTAEDDVRAVLQKLAAG